MLRIPVLIGGIALITIGGTMDSRRSSERMAAAGRLAVPCRATDGFANEFRLFAVDVITGTDTSTRVAWNIPAVPAGEIYFVTDSTTCARAARAHAIATRGDTLRPAPVLVLRAGPTRYIVFNGFRSGEFLTYFVFDSAFYYLGAV